MKLKKYLVILLLSAILYGCVLKCGCVAFKPVIVNVKDNFGNVVAGATVNLYLTQTDCLNQTNAICSPGISDSAGNAGLSISNPGIKTCYCFASDSCRNNSSSISTPITIVDNDSTGYTAYSTVISGTGILILTNTSADPYHVFIRGTQVGDIGGNMAQQYYNLPTANDTVEVKQISGYTTTPVDEVFTCHISCMQTEKSFP